MFLSSSLSLPDSFFAVKWVWIGHMDLPVFCVTFIYPGQRRLKSTTLWAKEVFQVPQLVSVD